MIYMKEPEGLPEQGKADHVCILKGHIGSLSNLQDSGTSSSIPSWSSLATPNESMSILFTSKCIVVIYSDICCRI